MMNFPAVFTSADESSKRAQTRFLTATGITLGLLAIAAVMGALDTSWSAWVGAGAFLAAIVVGALAVTQNLERTWYDGRALAESAKSLTWLYAVRGGRFADNEDGSFRDGLRELSDELRRLSYVVASDGEEITPSMAALRSSPLDVRRESYDRERLRDQIDYYRARSDDHRRYARWFQRGTWAAQTLGLTGAVLRAIDAIHVDLLGIGAACAASLTAWLQTRDHVTTARAYEVTAEDLRRVREDAPPSGDEDAWGSFVAGAEAAMSREHVMWIARRER